MNTNSYKYKEAERVSAVFKEVTMEMAAVLIEIYFMTIITCTIKFMNTYHINVYIKHL